MILALDKKVLSLYDKAMENGALQTDNTKPTKLVGNERGFKNHGLIKSAARGIVLEALTAFKGNKVGKRGLLVKAMDELSKAMDAKEVDGKPLDNVAIRARKDWAIEQILKMANGMTKDDKASGLEELLKGGANVQINFNQHFANRSNPNQPGYSIEINHPKNDQENPAGQSFTPPPGSGEAP